MNNMESRALRTRAEGLKRWLEANASACHVEQRHLDQDTTERAYWHYGYLCALRDVLELVKDPASRTLPS